VLWKFENRRLRGTREGEVVAVSNLFLKVVYWDWRGFHIAFYFGPRSIFTSFEEAASPQLIRVGIG
jgi:hypothetical protein